MLHDGMIVCNPPILLDKTLCMPQYSWDKHTTLLFYMIYVSPKLKKYFCSLKILIPFIKTFWNLRHVEQICLSAKRKLGAAPARSKIGSSVLEGRNLLQLKVSR